MKMLLRNINFKSATAFVLAISVLMLSLVINETKKQINEVEFREQNGSFLSSHSLINHSNLLNDFPNEEKGENTKENVNIEEEIDFLKSHPASSIFFSSSSVPSNKKGITEENLITFFHLELLVPPPNL